MARSIGRNKTRRVSSRPPREIPDRVQQYAPRNGNGGIREETSRAAPPGSGERINEARVIRVTGFFLTTAVTLPKRKENNERCYRS